MDRDTTPLQLAHGALRHLISRMAADPRLAYLIGFGSETFDQVTAAVAAIEGLQTGGLREQLARDLATQRVPPIGHGSPDVDFQDRSLRIDPELYMRMAQYNDHTHDMNTAEGLNQVLNHFLMLGVQVAESDRAAAGSGELF